MTEKNHYGDNKKNPRNFCVFRATPINKMKILFLSNFYPPYIIGGMEAICKSVVDGFTQRGHQCLVLTSYHGLDRPTIEDGIARQLHLEMKMSPLTNAITFFFLMDKHIKENRARLRSWIDEFEPDLIFIWGMWNLHRILARESEEIMSGKVLYEFGDYWPTLPSQYHLYWDRPGKTFLTRVIRQFIRPIAKCKLLDEPPINLNFQNSYCVSQAVKNHLIDLGVPVQNAPVVPNGLDLSNFYQNLEQSTHLDRKLHKLLFVGRVQQIKGLHIALDALNLLRQALPDIEWRLTIIGISDVEYLAEIRVMIDNYKLATVVDFVGELPYTQIPSRMHEHGILLIPSIWEEPFGLVAIEGMAAGCLVIASEIGGLSEIVDHGKTGFLCRPGDSQHLSDTISHIATHPQLARQIIHCAQKTVLERYSFDQMLDQIQQLLYQATSQAPPVSSDN